MSKKRDLKLNLQKAKNTSFEERKIVNKLTRIEEKNKKILSEADIDVKRLRIVFEV